MVSHLSTFFGTRIAPLPPYSNKEGHVSIFNMSDDDHPHLKLGYIPWIDQRGGGYFFTPSIKALEATLSEE